MEENYVERLKKVENELEVRLQFEQGALDKWPKPKDQEQADKQRDFTEPIIRTVLAYEHALSVLRQYFPELKSRK